MSTLMTLASRGCVTLVLAGWAGMALASGPTEPAAPSRSEEVPAECDRAPFREFDFWLGEWSVTVGGKMVATSRIESILGGCVILESYEDPSGYRGQSFNFYDSHLKKWRQTWVDTSGSVSEFSGAVRDGAMRYEGETHRQGRRILRRMTVSHQGRDRVRQFSEHSTDEGKTWAIAYDFVYLRTK